LKQAVCGPAAFAPYVAGRETGRRGLKHLEGLDEPALLRVAGRETGRRGLKLDQQPGALPGNESPAGKPVGVD